MKLGFICILILVLSSCYSKSHIQSITFPATIERRIPLPKKENTWVFILAGQSNMAGRGLVEPQDTIPSEKIFTINSANEIIIAKEPLHYYEPNMKGLDCGLSFAKELSKKIADSITIILLPVAVGGSSVFQWLGDSLHRDVKLLTNFREKVEIGHRYGKIKGILWHQGENDAISTPTPAYQLALTTLLNQFRKFVNNDTLPIILGELGLFSKDSLNWARINRAINVVADQNKFIKVVRTHDLNHKGDFIHFDSPSQRLLGKRYADTFLSNFSE